MARAGSGSVELTQLEPHQLDRLNIVAQCLDNQWVPQRLLTRMLAGGLSLADVAEQRRRHVYGEYIRAFINARQVVVNRAYFLNNPVVFYDFTRDRHERAALRTLLSARALVPFLYAERSPLDEVGFHVLPAMTSAWRELVSETDLACARLSWNDQENSRLIDTQLARRFGEFVTGSVSLVVDESGAARLARDFQLDPAELPGLRQRLAQVGRWGIDQLAEGRIVTRDALYQKFVVVDGSPTAAGRYDRAKPYAAVIKQLFDLRYNVSLPDALGGFPLTPQDSPPRSALQELERERRHPSVRAEELIRLLRGRVFEIAQHDLSVAAFEHMRLSDVLRVREHAAWLAYTERLERLLVAPVDFANLDPVIRGVQDVFASYAEVARLATGVAAERRHGIPTFRWRPVVTFVLKAASALLFVWFVEGAAFFEAFGEVAATAAVELVVDVSIGHVVGDHDVTLPSTSYELLRRRLDHPRADWNELIEGMRQLSEFTESGNAPRETRQPPGMALEKVDA
jgi:hypothetical protein